MATISNVNGKKITKIKYKGEIYDTGGSGGTDWLKEYLDETHDASYLFCGDSNDSAQTTWHYYLTYERLQKALKYNTTSSVKDMQGMFYNCVKLTTIPLIDTSLVTNMSSMFYFCSSLTTIPQLDTSKVTNMSWMFSNCSSLTTIPQIVTSNVTNMNRMFNSCGKLTTISQLDTRNVTNMLGMFAYCYILTKIDITHMNINTTSNNADFCISCYSLTKLIIRNMPTIPALSSNAFNKCYHFTGTTDATYNPQGLKDGRIYVPDDKVDELKAATNWSVYADIIVPLSTLVE